MSESESQLHIPSSVTTTDFIAVLPTAAASEAPKNLAEIIVSQIQELNDHHRNVIATGDVDAVHKMRVTTRRLQSSLDLLQFGKQEKEIKKLKHKLRVWRRKLSRVRNYDVFLESLECEAAKHKQIQKSLSALKEELHKRRHHLAKKVMAYLTEINVAKVARALALENDVTLQENSTSAPNGGGECDTVERKSNGAEALSTSDPAYSLTHIAEDEDIHKRAAKRIDQRLEEFLFLAGQARPTTHPEELHQLRIAAKRLRYLLEVATEMGFNGSHTALDWLKSLQDRIGEWHDLESLEDEILTIIANREFMKERLVETGVILAATIQLQKKRKKLISRLFPVKVHKRVESSSRRIAKAFSRSA